MRQYRVTQNAKRTHAADYASQYTYMFHICAIQTKKKIENEAKYLQDKLRHLVSKTYLSKIE